MYNKRGLSAIVATVLIILLVIAGVTLVWTPVRKLITSQSEELEASCLLANPQITKACMSAVSTVAVTISNGAEGEIDGGFQFIYGTPGNLNMTITDTTAIGVNQVQTISFTNASIATAVKIAPIMGTETCAAGSEVTITASC